MRRPAALVSVVMCAWVMSCQPVQDGVLKFHSFSLKKERAAFNGIPEELASLGSASLGHNYWVEGTIENTGSVDVGEVVIAFHCIDGTERRKLMAELPVITASGQASFRTRVLPSVRNLVLLDEDPEITFEWRD